MYLKGGSGHEDSVLRTSLHTACRYMTKDKSRHNNKCSGSASQAHCSVQGKLLSLHEQHPLHKLVTHPHLTIPSLGLIYGASGTLVSRVMSSPTPAFCDQPSDVGLKTVGHTMSTCCHTLYCMCAHRMCSCIAPCIGGSFSTP